MTNSVEIKNLSLKYSGTDFKAIDNLNLTIQKGEVLGLLGPNGAGKTSLISILTGLIKPNEGKVIIEGLETSKNIEGIRKLIGVVPQEYALYPKLTAKENLMLDRKSTRLNSSHVRISYAVFCLKKKKKK